jgi:hypothetical protein
MIRPLSHLGGHFFGLMYLLFRFLILSDSGSGNYMRLKVRPNVLVFDLGFLSW